MAKATFEIPGMRISGKPWGAVRVPMPDGPARPPAGERFPGDGIEVATRTSGPVVGEPRTRAFFAFAAGALEATIPVERGGWACAVRFVREATGQEATVLELGVVEAA